MGGVIELERRNRDCFSWRTCRRECHVKLIEPNFQRHRISMQSWCERANLLVRTYVGFCVYTNIHLYKNISSTSVLRLPKITTSNRPTDAMWHERGIPVREFHPCSIPERLALGEQLEQNTLVLIKIAQRGATPTLTTHWIRRKTGHNRLRAHPIVDHHQLSSLRNCTQNSLTVILESFSE